MKNMCLCQDVGANEESVFYVRIVLQRLMKNMCLCQDVGANEENVFVSGLCCKG